MPDTDQMDTGASSTASGNNVRKEEVLELMEKKRKVEEELKELYGVLNSHKVTLDEPLVDAQGYPRADVDVYQVRRARARINCLRNDLKGLMDSIESGIHNLHAQSREGLGADSPQDLVDKTSGIQLESPPDCFALIDVVTEGSPAEESGLRVGDRVAAFGSVRADNFTNLSAIGRLVQDSKNRELEVTVVRAGRARVLKLTPRQWAGRGLLGCNIVPLENNSEENVER